MSLSYITIPYHIILYLMFFYFISSADSIFNSTSFQIDLILFYPILLNSIYYIVQYSISYQWMICVSLSVRPSVCLYVCLFICMNKFMFSSLLFLHSFFFIFLFSFVLLFFYSLFSWTSSSHIHTHTQTRTRTHKYIWIYVPSYDSYILLQKGVSEESYSSDSIISYLI